MLSLNDQIVYQAVANYIAEEFAPVLRRNYLKKAFGALYTSRQNPFFYRPWKVAYRSFNRAIERAFRSGYAILANFDLVSFYDLIDHKLLQKALESRVRSREVLDLLDRCLKAWTAVNTPSGQMSHGIPQGPLPSAFLAECFLHSFDRENFGNVQYFRYVDDIRLLGKRLSTVRRALVKLDLKAKEMGLVPQAQKIDVREVRDIRAELKNIPSPIASTVAQANRRLTRSSRRRLQRLLKTAVVRRGKRIDIVDPTRLKYLLYRMPRSIRILRSIAPVFYIRPDYSPALSSFTQQFRGSREAASILYNALKEDPVFDATASDYVFALDACEPKPAPVKYLRLVSKLMRRSAERGVLLAHAVRYYEAKRLSGACPAFS